MRKVTFRPACVFALLMLVVFVTSIGLAVAIGRGVPLGGYQEIATVAIAALLVFAVSVAVYRLFLHSFPLREGPIEPGSRDEFAYHVYLLFYFFLFYPITCTRIVPVPVMRLVYIALGARLGRDTYSAGSILDPPLTTIGDHSLIGQDALLYSHAIEGDALSHAAIRIGSHVTVGARAIVMSGVVIEDGAIVGAGAVVRKGTRIRAGEVWAGIPARRIEPRPAEASGGEPQNSFADATGRS